jgi:hypothetical protein
MSGSPTETNSIWQTFERLSDVARADAQFRFDALCKIDRLVREGAGRTAAAAQVAAEIDVTAATVWNWARTVKDVPVADWLPHLAPRKRGGGGERAAIDPDLWATLTSDYLRLSRPSWQMSYRRTKRIADARGLAMPSVVTLWRRFERETPAETIILRRDGEEALRRTRPTRRRSVAHLHALEIVCIDGHRFDVFVRWPDGTIARPIMVALQDIHSRKLVAWRIGRSEDMLLTRRVFGDLFRAYGIPKACLLDNGRGFAGKEITGGAKTRYRFTIREDELHGLLPSLSIEPKWALPYRGQSKPIERAFRDLCDSIAKHPECEGAYTGNRPDAKPENYGNAAVPIDMFEQLVDREIGWHNARPGRETEMCCAEGLSFDQAFERSYATAPIGRMPEEQLRLALLVAKRVRARKPGGEVVLFRENRYWTPELIQYAGEEIVARYDPDDLTLDLHVYAADGSYICAAPRMEDAGFDDLDEARATMRDERAFTKAARKAAAVEDRLSARQLAREQRGLAADVPPGSTSNVTRMVHHKPKRQRAAMPPREDATVVAIREAPEKVADADRLIAAAARGEQVDADDLARAKAYAQSHEYRAEVMMQEDFGLRPRAPVSVTDRYASGIRALAAARDLRSID